MLTSTAFTVILIHDEGPRLASRLELLGHSWYRTHGRFRWLVIVIKGRIYISILVVDGLTTNGYWDIRIALIWTHSDYWGRP